MKLFVLDTHTIYRRGLVACLDPLEEVESVAQELSYSGRTVKNVLHDVVTSSTRAAAPRRSRSPSAKASSEIRSFG